MARFLRTVAVLVYVVVGGVLACGGSLLADDGPPKKPADVAALLKQVAEGGRGGKLAALGVLRQAAVHEQLGEHKKGVIKQCAELMYSKDGELSEAACDVLSWLDAEAVPPLVEALQSKDLRVRSDAARLISSIASRYRSQAEKMDAAIPHLARLLEGKADSADTARHNAFYAMAELGPRAIPHMIARLDAEEYFQRVMMEGFVRHGEKSVEPLCKALRTGDVATRQGAAFMLFQISWRAPDVLPALERKALGPLTEAIGDTNQLVRSRAIDTLGRMEGRAKPALEKIIAALEKPGAPFYSIAGALGRIGPEPKHLEALLDGAERMAAAATSDNDRQRARGAFGEAIAAVGGAAVDRVIGALDDRREAVRETAMWALYYLGPKAAKAVPAVIGKLNGGDRLAPEVLGAIGPAAEAAVPHLIRRLEHDEWAQPRRGFAIMHDSAAGRALSAIGRPAIPALQAGLKHENDLVKAGCVIALEEMDVKAMVPLAAIEPLCGDENAIVRAHAMLALVKHGLAEERLAPILLRLQDDAHRGVAEVARRELVRLRRLDELFDAAERKAREGTSADDRAHVAAEYGHVIGGVDDKGVDRVIRALDDRRETVRATAMWALYYLGPKASAAVPRVIERLNDGDKVAPEVLGAIGREAKDAVPHLIRRLEHDDWEDLDRLSLSNHPTCARALARIGSPAIRALREGLKHKHHLVRAGSVIAFEEMQPSLSASELEAIEPLCRDEHALVRVHAMLALVRHGLSDGRLRPILVRLSDDAHPRVVAVAIRELEQLPKAKE
jgi:HEAT repeat protein